MHNINITIVFVEPKMSTLIQTVVPKVAHMWSNVAWQLELDTARVNIINKKCQGNPEDCCEEMFHHWLDSGEGVKPKQWDKLLEAIKRVTKLKAATEKIESELMKLSQ